MTVYVDLPPAVTTRDVKQAIFRALTIAGLADLAQQYDQDTYRVNDIALAISYAPDCITFDRADVELERRVLAAAGE